MCQLIYLGGEPAFRSPAEFNYSVYAKVDPNLTSKPSALYIPSFELIKQYLDEHAGKNDIVLTLGSGDVYKKTRLFLD